MPPDVLSILPTLLAIFFVGAVIQGATGMGFGLFSVAALSLLLQLKLATPLMSMLNAPVIFYVLWRLRKHVVKEHLGPIAVGLLIGVPVGTFVLVSWPQELLLRILGIVLIFAAVRALWPSNGGDGEKLPASPGKRHSAAAVLTGFVSGALGGAFNTGGPPIIAYVYCHPWTKEQRSAMLQAVFTVSVTTRMIAYAVTGLYTVKVMALAAACLPAVALGTLAGYALFRRVPDRGLEVFVGLFLVAVSAKLLIAPG